MQNVLFYGVLNIFKFWHSCNGADFILTENLTMEF